MMLAKPVGMKKKREKKMMGDLIEERHKKV